MTFCVCEHNKIVFITHVQSTEGGLVDEEISSFRETFFPFYTVTYYSLLVSMLYHFE